LICAAKHLSVHATLLTNSRAGALCRPQVRPCMSFPGCRRRWVIALPCCPSLLRPHGGAPVRAPRTDPTTTPRPSTAAVSRVTDRDGQRLLQGRA
jgi:hypothetical protein